LKHDFVFHPVVRHCDAKVRINPNSVAWRHTTWCDRNFNCLCTQALRPYLIA
jgi:hypothetical protein